MFRVFLFKLNAKKKEINKARRKFKQTNENFKKKLLKIFDDEFFCHAVFN